jgi:hypothetical protein
MKLFIAFLLTSLVVAEQRLRGTTGEARPSKVMECHLTMECLSTIDVGAQRMAHHHTKCSPVDTNGIISDYSFSVDLPPDFVEQNKQDLVAGKLFASIPGGQIVDDKLIYPLNSPITLSSAPDSFEARRRRLSNAIGTKSLLVLRISANDASPVYTASQYYSYIFDSSQPDTAPTLVTQYSRVSFGKLQFVPTQYAVMEVPVNMNANGASTTTIINTAIAYVSSKYGVASMTQLADHILFCIPPGTGNWAGSSSVNSWRMVMNNDWCGDLSALMHEMGHNLGLLHSNQNNIEYMDFTSYMSAGYEAPYYPLKSFNGANNAQLGWYSDRMITVDPSTGGQKLTLATFVDYSKHNKANPVLIQLGTDVFLQYNRAKDFNIQAQQAIDQVTIVQQQNNGTSLLGSVEPSSSSTQYTILNLDGTGRNVVIHACSTVVGSSKIPDSMVIGIGYDKSYC